jgi:hypothetical protein
MDGKRQGIAASPEPPDLVYCPNAHKEDDDIPFRNGDGAGLDGGEADGKKRASSCAVPFLFVLVLLGVKSCTIPRQSCAANERFGRGERTGYISRGTPAPSREPKKSSFAPSWAIY